MAFWTPYASEVPLDLSKISVKEERRTPVLGTASQLEEHAEYVNPQYNRVFTEEHRPLLQYPSYFAYPPYPATLTDIPPPQVSSTSNRMMGAEGYHIVPTVLQPEVYQQSRPATLSPPESLECDDQRQSTLTNYFVEEDLLSEDPKYQAFERNALRAMAEKNGGALLGNNPRMCRTVKSTKEDASGDSYRRQRARNNYAAKQSRDRRKMREIRLSLKAAYLQNEVTKIKGMLTAKTCRCQRPSW